MRNKLAIFIVIGAFAFNSNAKKENSNIAVEVTSATVVTADLFDVFNVVGECRNDNSRDYYANISGKLEMVSTREGQEVKKGDILLIIDQDIAKTTKTQAEALFATSNDIYKRNVELSKKKFISAEELERSQSELENARLALFKAVKTYNDMLITAPFDGIMGVVEPKVGDDIKQGDFLFSVINPKATQSIFIELPQILHGQISTSTGVLVTDNKNDQIAGQITSVAQYLSSTGTLNAKITIPTVSSNFLHGSYVDVSLIINKHSGLAVPEQSLQRNNQGNFVYKIENNIAKQIYVKIATRTNGLVEINSPDIHEGDLVVLNGFTKLDDGKIIKLLNQD